MTTVAVLYAAVRRTSGPGAGCWPAPRSRTDSVAALMFRFNNPDALLVLLLVVGGYCVVRALRGALDAVDCLGGHRDRFPFLASCCRRSWSCPPSGW